VNPTVERFTGHSAEEVLAMPDFIPILIAEEDRNMFRVQFREALNGSRGENLEFRYLHKNGSKSWLSASWQPILDEEGHSLGVRASFHDIADRKRAEESLRTSEERLRLTLDAAGIVAWEEGPAGGTIRETGPVGRLFGRAGGFRHPTVGDLAASIHPEDRERVAAAGDEARRRGSDFDVDFRVPLDGGEEKWIVARGTWLRDAEGKPTRMLGVAFDITERKRAEEALRKSDERLRSTLEAVGVVAWEDDLVHGTLHETGPVDKLFGSAEGFRHRTTSDLAASIHPEDRERVVAARDQARRGERDFDAEFRVPLDGGGEKWIRSRGTVQRDAAGRPVRLLGVASDITERKRAEEALRESEQRYRGLFGSLLDGFAYCKMLYDDQGQPVDFIFLVINDAFEQLTGLRNVVGKPVSEMMPGIFESNPELLARHDRVASTGKSEKFEAYFIPLASWLKVSVYSSEKGYFAAVFDNITERKQHEADREATLALLRLLNAPNDTHELIRTVVGLLREWSGCEAVGIRLREGDDYPYYETHGFPPEFVQAENHLCACDAAGELLRDSQGNPVLECMCGNVLCGRTNPRLASTTEADRQGRTRNRCNGEGYESVALIPLRYSGRTLGLVQLNDPRSGRFTLEKIAFLERAAGSIAIALEQRSTQAALRASEARYRLISENTSDVIWLLDVETQRFTYVSPSVRKMCGYPRKRSWRNPWNPRRNRNPTGAPSAAPRNGWRVWRPAKISRANRRTSWTSRAGTGPS
jgi:PAS domain S-box-containing protein